MVVTIAIPFYNSENYLELAIKSVLNQTYSDWKLILVDDGSLDNSLKIAEKYQNLDNRIKVYSDGKNKNLAYRLNEIAKLTDTKYLARMDADDIMHPDRIKIQLEILEANPEIDVLGTNAFSINEYNNVKGIRLATNLDNPKLIDCFGFIHPTIMAKKEWFLKNPYDIKAVRIEDAELWRRTRLKNNFKVYTQPLLYYREFGDKYYLKYFKSLKGAFYVFMKEAKNQYNFSYFFEGFIKNLILGLVFFLFNLIDKEKILIKKRYFEIPNDKIEILN